jgi:nucleoside-triphosphatase THEP1
MKKNILITGIPKSGKSTLLKKLITSIQDKVGFVTNEVLYKDSRVGFEIENNTGYKVVLSHIDFKTPFQVSRYFVNIDSLDSMIPKVYEFQEGNILYLDEIGEMQLFSEKFKGLVLKYLDSPNICLSTLSYVFENDFTKQIKERDDIMLIEISTENREEKEKFIIQLLKKIEKAKKYISEPDRFIVHDSWVELKSEHGIRKIVFNGGICQCNCDFFTTHNVCSHVIATEEIIKNKR